MDKTKVRNRWQIFNVLINEQDVNYNNMMIDLMIANLTANFEFILKNAHCNTGQRKIPNFNVSNKRMRRSIAGFVRKVGNKCGKYVAWTTVLASSAVIGSGVSIWLDHKLNRDDYLFVWELEHSCKKYNFGCHHNLCWANCGVRSDSSDWCFTKSTEGNFTRMTPFGIVQNAKFCNSEEDCNACEKCTSDCFVGEASNN